MNIEVAELIRGYVKDASFADKVAGLVQVVRVGETNTDGVRVEKTFPVSCSYTFDECKKGKYAELVPNNRNKSIMYFEDNGLSFTGRDGRFINVESRLKLVCWADMKKLGLADYNSPSMVAEILKLIPQVPITSGKFIKLEIIPQNQDIRSNAIFARYTYNEAITQYLFYPYDHFAINFLIRFKLIPECHVADPDCVDCP